MNIRFKPKVFSSLFYLVFCITSISFGQSDPTGERRVTGTFAITNATVTIAPGKTQQGATIIIKNGLIEAIGSNLRIPIDAQTIKGDSLFVYPGFIDGATSIGVLRPNDPERPANFDPSNPPDEFAGITPWRSVLDHYDIKNSQINDWRKVGFTVAQIVPEGGMLPGKSAIVTYGGKESNNILAKNTALAARFRSTGGGRGMYPGTQLGIMAKFRDLYKNAELSSQHMRLFASNSGLSRPEINKTLEAFFPVLDKSIPVLYEVSNDLELRRAVMLQKENGFRLVVAGITDMDFALDAIKSSNAQVLVSFRLPNDKTANSNTEGLSDEMKARTQKVKDAYIQILGEAGKLEAAGIPFGFTSLGGRSNEMYKNIRLMIANGLSENAALAALTINNANILGIQKFAGTLEKGKLANMVISTAPLFAEEAQIKYVVADGYVFEYEVNNKKSNNNGNGKAVDLSGIWDYTSDTPAGSSGGTMEIKRDGTSYKGTISYDNPSGSGKASSPMNNIILSGNNLSFTFNVSAGGMSLEVSVSGEITDGDFSGSMSLSEFGSFPFNAVKKPNHLNQ
ncbi:amidohydrolase family protein [Cecembia rubra]|uniref:Imidazolonepropionase-like amidohydrolase n=1 Tax=Cecembia rubra TaxID=1485585 RepID=A0A2P8EEL9_9BACT|nr:amidohydrolase family protein [Cecembia rubra]PSL07901.1 imidazolonepropionase-like amidohydrolase [Cecembia rubra]